MKIEYIPHPEEIEIQPKDFIYVNYRKIDNYAVSGYFTFLSTAVGVKVEKIITKRLSYLGNKFKHKLHNMIHSQLIGGCGKYIESLIGLEELCDGCEKCSNIAKTCLEYGPLRLSTLQTMTYSKNYKKLHVTDKLFEDIAEYCISKSKNKEGCFKELDETILSTISCDKLVIWVNESRLHPNEETRNHMHMPREVIDIILRKWNVKSVKLNMIFYTNGGLCSVDWLQYNYFTPVRLNDPYSITEKSSDLKFSHVDVRMSDSIYCVRGFGNHHSEIIVPRGYHNFIPNIRRLFPTDKISIDLSHWFYIAETDIEKKMSTILQVVTMEKQRKLSLSMKFFVKSSIVKKVNEETNKAELRKLAPKYRHRRVNFQSCVRRSLPIDDVDQYLEEFNQEKWIGRRFQVEDIENLFNFNLNVYIKEKELEEGFDKQLLQEYPNSFVGHFYE
ncbi:hypothetical protein GCK72_011546 [Caenorhabditis remanei]|uniref:Uncharacterized protein n=1 Tax=Caenorhabditis remanei TaxID=31234 RepID=A0A6A5H628_CAERE|nr:hypothetical protein GCK72_011546 [Caenorhabditis remanei]KAF1763280.1 hypothetical protein GCK72_011546 [Caenorhabditis remanei]